MYLKFQRRTVSQFLAFKWTQQHFFYNFTHFCLKNDPPKMLLCGPLLCVRHVKILLTPAPTPPPSHLNLPIKVHIWVTYINISFPFFKKNMELIHKLVKKIFFENFRMHYPPPWVKNLKNFFFIFLR